MWHQLVNPSITNPCAKHKSSQLIIFSWEYEIDTIRGHYIAVQYILLPRQFQGFRVWGKFVFQTLELTDTPTNLANHALSNRADLRERTKTISGHGDRRGQIADFWDSFETINWRYLLFKCGIKTKTHFEWLLWHWSSLGQLNLEPTRPNGLMGCKVPTDLVKISVKEATHMGFHYNIPHSNAMTRH